MVPKLAIVAIAATAAAAVVGAVGQIQAAKSAKAVGKANQALAERDAQVAEQKKAAVQNRLSVDVDSANRKFATLQSQTATAYRFSGVDPTEGTPLGVQIQNVQDFEYDKRLAEYNASIDQMELDEYATFARMKGDVQMLQAKAAARSHKMAAFGSLLSGTAQGASLGAKYSS